MTIGWIEISRKKYGGVVYNEEARRALAKLFDVELVVRDARFFKNFRYLKIPESLFYLLGLRGTKSVWIRDFYSVLTLPFDKTKGKNITVVHHDDFSGFPMIPRIILSIIQKVFYYRILKKVDAIVTVSEYWKQYFIQKGYRNVYKIYNGFDIPQFQISDEEVLRFKKKYEFEEKPIVYLGNCQKPKGVVEAYRALRDLDVQLVTSGKRMVNIPAVHLELDYREYLCLLRASTVAIAMSKFREGWCRTAHEAMLLKTPVIGSGLGGMRELLEGGEQIVCEDFKNLKEKVEYLLQHSEEAKQMGERGHAFSKDFSQERFRVEWIQFIKNTVSYETT